MISLRVYSDLYFKIVQSSKFIFKMPGFFNHIYFFKILLILKRNLTIIKDNVN
jgi:hypothetical protein